MSFMSFFYFCAGAGLFLTLGLLNFAILIKEPDASGLNFAGAVVGFSMVFLCFGTILVGLPS